MAVRPPAQISSGARSGERLVSPARRSSPQTRSARSGMNMIGSQPSAISAVASTLLPISDAHQIGIVDRTGWLMSLSGLPSPVPWPSGSGTWTVWPS